jgi:hypothetical protein
MFIEVDQHGPYVKGEEGRGAYRPGWFKYYSQKWDTSSSEINSASNVTITKVKDEAFVMLVRADGSRAYWGSAGRNLGDFEPNSSNPVTKMTMM